jgi:hypothetical protein
MIKKARKGHELHFRKLLMSEPISEAYALATKLGPRGLLHESNLTIPCERLIPYISSIRNRSHTRRRIQ